MNTFAAHGRLVQLADIRAAVGALLLTVLSSGTLHSQTDGTCIPIAERAGREFGCFITARQELGRLPQAPPLFWHLDTYPSRAAAAADGVARSTVVESLGRVWLFTIAPAGW